MSVISEHVLILGCGYTGRRFAQLLLDAGIGVTATTRSQNAPPALARRGLRVIEFDAARPVLPADAITAASCVVYSIPTVILEQPGTTPQDATPRILKALPCAPRRLVYVSTTGVYGDTREVNEKTPISPQTRREQLRAAAERAVTAGHWQSLILRPAAIYGPGRGVHTAMLAGKFLLAADDEGANGPGKNMVSRIHVDDLAAHLFAAVHSDVTGAYPVADEEPCTSLEIAQFCARLVGIPLPPAVARQDLSETRRANRRVDGSAIRRVLGIQLRYPSYRVGIPACLAEESASASTGG